jgi:hypothetical protein
MAAGDLTTLEDVKAWLAIAADGSNDVLTDLVSATSADFLRAISRTDFLTATYTEVREGDGNCRIAVRHWPITAIASISVSGTSLAVSPDRIAAGYYFEDELDPEHLNQIYLAGGEVFPDLAPVAITYTAGYADAPLDVAQAVIEWVCLRYKGRPGAGVNSQREAGGEHITYDKQAAMPDNTARVVEKYSRTMPSLDKRADDRADKVTRINRTYTETVK